MARSLFGGRASDSVATLFNIGARSVLAPPAVSVTLEVWSGPEADGGTRLTDLLAADGTTAITAVTVPASAHGQIPSFYGPDGVTQVWFRDTEGDFYRLDADAGEAAARAVEAAAAAEAVGTTNDTIIAGRIQDPASATASALSASIGTQIQAPGTPAREAVDQLLANLAEGVASAEELTFSWFDGRVNLRDVDPTATVAPAPAAVSWGLFVAPFPLAVVQLGIVNWNATIPASDSAYWTFTLRRVRAGATAEIASISTRATGAAGVPHGAMPQRTARNFDGATFEPTNQIFQKDDIIAMAFIPTGTPTSLAGVTVSGRYVAL